MSANYVYLNVPGIQGDVTDPNYLGWITLNTFAFDGPAGADPSTISGFTITYDNRDMSVVTSLYQLCASGKTLEQVQVAFLKQGDDGSSITYMLVTGSSATVDSVICSQGPTTVAHLACAKISYTAW